VNQISLLATARLGWRQMPKTFSTVALWKTCGKVVIVWKKVSIEETYTIAASFDCL
jgi:hypothetical protein